MIAVKENTFGEVYRELLRLCNYDEVTRETSPRDQVVLEFKEPVSWTIEKPWNCWLTFNNRKLNPFFAAAEVFWILSGDSSVNWITQFNKTMNSFSDGGTAFNAAYGRRIRRYEVQQKGDSGTSLDGPGFIDQVKTVVQRLCEDRYTRRAAMTLWHPLYDNQDSKDIACNNMVYFTIRDDKLHTTVVIRSNDLIWGTPYNMIQFQHLAMLVVGEYNKTRDPEKFERISRGTHTVVANNLHMYRDLYKDVLENIYSNDIVEGFNQDFCDAQITDSEFESLYVLLETMIAQVTADDYTFKDFVDFTGSKPIEGYWDQLSLLPVLYLLWKKSDQDEVFGWIVECMDPVFGWLVDDFRGGHEKKQ